MKNVITSEEKVWLCQWLYKRWLSNPSKALFTQMRKEYQDYI